MSCIRSAGHWYRYHYHYEGKPQPRGLRLPFPKYANEKFLLLTVYERTVVHPTLTLCTITTKNLVVWKLIKAVRVFFKTPSFRYRNKQRDRVHGVYKAFQFPHLVEK